MSKIFCGITEVPKGQKRGSQEECFNKGQIRYYGVKKIDKSFLKEQKVSTKKHRKSLMLQISENRGKIRKLEMDHDRHANYDKKKEFKLKIQELKEQNSELLKKYRKINEEEMKSKKSKKSHKVEEKKKKKSKNSRTMIGGAIVIQTF